MSGGAWTASRRRARTKMVTVAAHEFRCDQVTRWGRLDHRIRRVDDHPLVRSLSSGVRRSVLAIMFFLLARCRTRHLLPLGGYPRGQID